jgi:hypothetical protein
MGSLAQLFCIGIRKILSVMSKQTPIIAVLLELSIFSIVVVSAI